MFLSYSITDIWNNGKYIPFIYPAFYYLSQSHIISWAFTHKLLAINYYYHYGHIYNKKMPGKLYLLKPFVRLTDTGFILAILYYFNPTYFLHITHNILFCITVGYWGTRLLLNMKDTDETHALQLTTNIDHNFVITWSNINHILPYTLIVYDIINYQDSCIQFNHINAIYTFIFTYSWLLFIWLPWFHITGDFVYSVLDFNKSIKTPILAVSFMHIVIYLSNIFGNIITNNNICQNII